MHGPRIVDVTAVEVGSGWVGRASQAAGHALLDMRLHSPHAAASLVFSPTLCCSPGRKEIEQDAAAPGGSRHADC